MSLAQVAGTELTRQAVHLIETGKVRPSIRSLRIIARRLGVPAESFQLVADGQTDSPQRWAAEFERLCHWQRYDDVVALGRNVLVSADSGTGDRAVANLYVGRALIYMGQAGEALLHLRRAVKQLSAEDDPWLAAEAREWEGGALMLLEDPRSVFVCEDALSRYRELEPRRPEIEARMLEHIAACMTQQGDFLQARQRYEEALQIAGPVLDLVRLARIYHGMSGCQARLGEIRRAIDMASRAVALYAVEEDLRPVPARIDLPRIENDLGTMLLMDGQLDRAEELFHSALHRLEVAGVMRLRSYVTLSLAELAQTRQRLDEALELAERAVEQAEQAQERMAVAVAQQQLGGLRAERQEQDLALQAYDRALTIWTELGLTAQLESCQAARQRALAPAPPARLERFAG